MRRRVGTKACATAGLSDRGIRWVLMLLELAVAQGSRTRWVFGSQALKGDAGYCEILTHIVTFRVA